MSSSLLHLVCKRRHGVVNPLPCLSPMWKLRPCHSSTKLPHLCHCLIQLCQNNIICSPSPSLAIAHMFTNTEVQMLLSLNKQKITFAQTGFQQVSARGVLVFAGLCGLLGEKQVLTGQRLCVGSVGCWRQLKCLYNDLLVVYCKRVY